MGGVQWGVYSRTALFQGGAYFKITFLTIWNLTLNTVREYASFGRSENNGHVTNHNMITMAMVIFKTYKMADKGEERVLTEILVYSCLIEPFICLLLTLNWEVPWGQGVTILALEFFAYCSLCRHFVLTAYVIGTSKIGKHAKSLCLFLSLIFYIIRKKNALETAKKVSWSIIYFLMSAKSKFYCNFSRCFCFSLGEWATGRRRRL